MHHALNGRPFLDRSSELFFELALEGLLGRLPRFHFSAGELPLERRGVVAAPLSNQQPPVTALNHRCNDGSHASRHLRNGLAGSSLSRAGRFGISSHPPLALAALLSFRTFQSSLDRKSTRLNSSHGYISYAVFCLKKKKTTRHNTYLSRDSFIQPCTVPVTYGLHELPPVGIAVWLCW